jgi:hypothetical protein
MGRGVDIARKRVTLKIGVGFFTLTCDQIKEEIGREAIRKRGEEGLFNNERRKQSKWSTKGKKFCPKFDAKPNTCSLHLAGLSPSLSGPNRPERFNFSVQFFISAI